MIRKAEGMKNKSIVTRMLSISILAMSFGVLVTATPAQAQISGQQCLKEKTMLNNPSCTANDVRIISLEVLEGNTCLTEGETVDVTLKATIESGPQRYDIGIWVNESGGSALSDPDGTCYRDFLDPVSSDNSDCDQVGGPYFNGELGESDTCGDVPDLNDDCSPEELQVPCTDGSGGTCTITETTFSVAIKCTDSNDDGVFDLSVCSSWDNNEMPGCSGALDTDPGTGSKCNCEAIPLPPDPCEGVDCSAFDTDCGIASCDRSGEPGNCDDITAKDAGTVCRAAVDVCDAEEVCDGTNTGACPADGFAAAGTACGSDADTDCDNPDTCDGSGNCQNNYESSTTVCRAAVDVCDVPETCDGSGSCPADQYAAAGTACGSDADTDCDNPDTCDGSGACQPNYESSDTVCRAADGECDVEEKCDGAGACADNGYKPAGTSCGSDADTDCDNPDTCDANGNCLDNYESSDTVCRAADGECDVEEKCDGAGNCPDNGYKDEGTACGDSSAGLCDTADTCDATGNCVTNHVDPGTECRAAANDCDVAEVCDDDGNCPEDGYAAAGTACGSDADTDCDNPDTCDGNGMCKPNYESSDTVCRVADGDCDVAEKCDGAGNCPDNGYAAEGTSCGSATDDDCDNPDTCDANGNCEPNYEPNTTVCRADAGDCDVEEKCDGAGSCPDNAYEPAGTVCGPPASDVCDAPDVCDDSGTCVPTSGSSDIVCREAAHECDVEEKCDGAGNCPDDGYAASGTPCGDGTDDVCDNPDSCDDKGECQPNYEPNTTECRADSGECDVAELCDGAGSCPDDGYEPFGTPCSDDGNPCTDDACDSAGECKHDPNTGACSDGDICSVGDACVAGECVPGPSGCDAICRTPGFWGARGGSERGGQNVTEAVIDLAGGSLQVCGQSITETNDIGDLDSALEGLCVSVRGVSQRQLYRQLVAFYLNCTISGGGDCDALVSIASECDSLCATGSSDSVSYGECISEIDCFNNGGTLFDGACALGTCSIDDTELCGEDFGGCSDVDDQSQYCENFEGNCHDASLCPVDGAFCFEPLGRASSKRSCSRARRNPCTIDSCPQE